MTDTVVGYHDERPPPPLLINGWLDGCVKYHVVYSGIQVLALYHDSLVSRAISQLPSTIPRRRETSHTRYTKYWSNERPLYRRVALVLQMIRYTELFWEMLARRRGEKVHRRVVVLIEAVKAICRFLLLRVTGSGLLVRAPLPEREADPRITEGEGEGEDNRAVNRDSEKQKPWPMPRTRLALPNLPDSADISSYLVSKALTAEDATPAKDIVHGNAGGKVRVAEMLYILCPLLYALILHRRRGKKRNWAPWVACVALEYFCRQLAKRGFAERLSGGLRALSRLEREELQMRAWHMGWWAFRGAFYDNVTRYVTTSL